MPKRAQSISLRRIITFEFECGLFRRVISIAFVLSLSTCSVAEQQSQSPAILEQSAEQLELPDHSAEALQKFNTVLAAEPENSRALAHRACLYNLLGRTDLALNDINHAIALDDHSAFSFAVRALILQKEPGKGQSLRDLNRAIELLRNPQPPPGGADPAFAAYDDADRAYALSMSFTLRAEIKAQHKEFTAALGDADAIIDLDPTTMSAWIIRASIERAQYRFNAALADDTKAMALQFHPEEPLLGLCGDYAALGLGSLALRRCNEAIALFPFSDRAHVDRGVMYLKAGDFNRASIDFDAALLKYPRFGLAIYGRGLARLGAGNTNPGFADLKAGMQADTDSEEWFGARGLKAPAVPRT